MRTPARREEGRLANGRIPPCGDQFPIVDQEDVNEVVPPQVPQVPQVPMLKGIYPIWI